VEDLEAKLVQAREQHNKIAQAMRHKNSGYVIADWLEAHENVLAAERALALAKGEETALAYPWEIKWDMGAPLPHVVASGRSAFLMYLVSEPDPNWDGTYVTVIDPASQNQYPIALVEIVGCYAFQFGGPNDEVFHGHPLDGKGLGGYGVYEVANSHWLAELERINSVHLLYNPANWGRDKHFMFLFHDEMFECIATGFKVEVLYGTFERVMEIATKRLFDK
jgi:hypothetical protein